MTRFKQYTTLKPRFVAAKLEEFFKEDNIQEDITTLSTQQDKKQVRAALIAKEALIFAGSEIIKQGFLDCTIDDIVNDGTSLDKGDIIATMSGAIDTILKKERVILNLMQRLSGIASTTHKLSQITNQYNIELLDTRKTTPGLRVFEKFAVTIGGGINHRFSLKDAIMIKDNHLMGSPDILQTIARAKQNNLNKDIQIEVETKEQLDIVLESAATSLLLDNFNSDSLPNIIQYIRSHPKGAHMYLELSGGITAKTLSDFCIKGVDGISMGALTHNIKSKDISLDLK
jgi:nicotinate-nucleotide pyrophosphorylase (carboxylating)